MEYVAGLKSQITALLKQADSAIMQGKHDEANRHAELATFLIRRVRDEEELARQEGKYALAMMEKNV